MGFEGFFVLFCDKNALKYVLPRFDLYVFVVLNNGSSFSFNYSLLIFAISSEDNLSLS